jgi:hypothetical protein
MGTPVHLVAVGANADLLEQGRRRIDQLEAL